ncbi:hypothetical protein BC567DRAFT_231781 [Phyllosticta citribraziliensis]
MRRERRVVGKVSSQSHARRQRGPRPGAEGRRGWQRRKRYGPGWWWWWQMDVRLAGKRGTGSGGGLVMGALVTLALDVRAVRSLIRLDSRPQVAAVPGGG